MIESILVAHCPKCYNAYIPHELRVPIKPNPPVDENGNKNPIEYIEIFPSGCLCGKSRIEKITKKLWQNRNKP
jgi:hypothetical protein